MESQWFIKGPKVVELEERIAAYCGSKRAVGMASGTDALLLSLMAYGVGRGDEVITTPYTFFATAGSYREARRRAGVRGHRAGDLQPRPPALVEAAVTPRTKAIIPVHLYGQCADMDPLMEIADRHGLVVIEDACQSIGSEYKGRRAGSIGHAGCFSFFPSKNLGAYGDAGMVTTDDDAIADALVSLREHGMKNGYYHARSASTAGSTRSRPPCSWSSSRDSTRGATAARGTPSITTGASPGARSATPHREPHCRHIYNQYMVRVRERDALMAHLKASGIGCALYYPLPLHLQECFRYLGYKEGGLPESEAAARETISIPVFTELREEELDYVATTVLDFCGRGSARRGGLGTRVRRSRACRRLGRARRCPEVRPRRRTHRRGDGGDTPEAAPAAAGARAHARRVGLRCVDPALRHRRPRASVAGALGNAATRFVADESDARESGASSPARVCVALFVAAVLAVGLSLFSRPFAASRSAGCRMAGRSCSRRVAAVGMAGGDVAQSLFRGRSQFGVYNALTLFSEYGELVFVVVAVRVGGGLVGAVVAVLSRARRRTVVGLRRRGPALGFARPSRKEMGAYLAYSLPLMPEQVLLWVINVSDRYVMSHFWTNADVGQYSAAYSVAASSVSSRPRLGRPLPARARFWDEATSQGARLRRADRPLPSAS